MQSLSIVAIRVLENLFKFWISILRFMQGPFITFDNGNIEKWYTTVVVYWTSV